MPALISVETAVERIKTHLPDWGEESVDLEQVRSGILAEPITADRAYPAAHRIMMDGIALAWESYNHDQRAFKILGTIAAGEPKRTLTDPLACYEIMTGAVLPDGCDVVIPYEDIQISSEGELRIAEIVHDQAWQRMANIHPQGSDFNLSEVLLRPGVVLNGPAWGILASVGKAQVIIKRLPRIQITATGQELIPVHQPPQPHQVRISNPYALKASLISHGFPDVDLDYVADDPELMTAHFQQQTVNYDLLIYCGGVSKGKFDYLPTVWSQAGVKNYIHGVAQRPGKPLWFGVDHMHQTAVFGLPGNPVSSLVCLHRYILQQRPMFAQLTTDFEFTKPLTYFLPVQSHVSSDARILATPHPMKNSGDFMALAPTDGFVELPADRAIFKAGESFPFFPW
ncbi:molybdopterin molybdotransferase MoeA [Thermosynechococcaceae cyanobacterium BACA0444]|uniref:Molybdopterin molybdenumtransferase n=1 Tax=Pseudocalidococcus azoricus BACA0444 TaxID=2918990 RepID=A0AAE4JVX0_9CYAN|nr:molybdopterin molybdotransferase MoeA [Pseudocalidococcus azoricus]MDS3860501.1 molybdopterin molybdotransferase MoeA [Pseudocalidococcus azoricus BACA0444]